MNWLKFLVGFSALIIAGCAAYFSVTGLGVLFAGATVSVMVMASALELAKLVAATYLKQKWDEIKGFNKWYLTSAVIALMIITSAGIFGYLSNAFQAQSLELQRVDREIAVFTTKIEQNNSQIEQLSTQITEFNQNQGKIIDGGKVNSRLLRSIDNRDRQIAKINDKISQLQDDNAKNTEEINKIKLSNLNLEKEVGGFRFVAEAFGLELNTVVKFFIFLIVIVFDPLAVALIIAFNGLIEVKNRNDEENLTKNVKKNEVIRQNSELDDKIYQVYGETAEDKPLFPKLVENAKEFLNNLENKEIIKKEEEKTEEELPDLKWEDYMHPEFPWQKRNLWINNPKAVQYWISYKKGSIKELNRIKSEEENTKTY